MKSVLIGIAAMVLISAGAWLVTESVATSSADKYVSQNNSVRLD